MSKPLDSQIIEALAGTFAEAMPVLVSLGDFAHLRVVAALTSQLPDSTVAAEATQVLVQKLTTLDDAKPLTEAIRALAQRCPQDDLGMALKDLLQGSAFFVGYELGKLDPNSPLYGAFAPQAQRMARSLDSLDALLAGGAKDRIRAGLSSLGERKAPTLSPFVVPAGSNTDAGIDLALAANLAARAGGPGRLGALDVLLTLVRRAREATPSPDARVDEALALSERAKNGDKTGAHQLFAAWNDDGPDDALATLCLGLLAVAEYPLTVVELAGPDDVDFDRDGPEICLEPIIAASQLLGADEVQALVE